MLFSAANFCETGVPGTAADCVCQSTLERGCPDDKLCLSCPEAERCSEFIVLSAWLSGLVGLVAELTGIVVFVVLTDQWFSVLLCEVDSFGSCFGVLFLWIPSCPSFKWFPVGYAFNWKFEILCH